MILYKNGLLHVSSTAHEKKNENRRKASSQEVARFAQRQ